MTFELSGTQAKAPGDIRTMGEGDTIYLRPSVKGRQDWMSLAPAILTAMVRGCSVIWKAEEGGK